MRKLGAVVMVVIGLSLPACTSGQTLPPTTQVAQGTIRGVLLREPAGVIRHGTLPKPMAGTVYIEFNNFNVLKALIVTVSTNGKFSRSVTPGTYKVLPAPKTGCLSTPITVHVLAGQVVTLKVKCGSLIG